MIDELNKISDLVNGGYTDIITLIGLALGAVAILYFFNDLRQARRRPGTFGRMYR